MILSWTYKCSFSLLLLLHLVIIHLEIVQQTVEYGSFEINNNNYIGY